MEAKCQQQGCSGEIIDEVCQVCGAGVSSSIGATLSQISAHPPSLSTLAEAQSLRQATRKSRTSTSASSPRQALGGELVQIKLPPRVEPLSLLRPGLRIPVSHRVCCNPRCVDEAGAPNSLVRMGADGKPVLQETGVCGKCGTPFSFEQLTTGSLISGQYEIKGPMAVGGCGFVYLAWDVNVGRYVILKGLINSQDPAAIAAAIQERQFLANLRDPSVVSIINFVAHKNQSFIVEEFIDGVSLQQLREEHIGPLLATEAIAYTLAMLPAFEYLHSRRPRVIFCDGKLLTNLSLKSKLLRSTARHRPTVYRSDVTDGDV